MKIIFEKYNKAAPLAVKKEGKKRTHYKLK